MNKFQVTIDGETHVLTYICRSHGGYQYNTEGDKAAHTFNLPLSAYRPNVPLITNGHNYVILKEL